MLAFFFVFHGNLWRFYGTVYVIFRPYLSVLFCLFCKSHKGESSKDVQLFGPFFDLPTYPPISDLLPLKWLFQHNNIRFLKTFLHNGYPLSMSPNVINKSWSLLININILLLLKSCSIFRLLGAILLTKVSHISFYSKHQCRYLLINNLRFPFVCLLRALHHPRFLK